MGARWETETPYAYAGISGKIEGGEWDDDNSWPAISSFESDVFLKKSAAKSKPTSATATLPSVVDSIKLAALPAGLASFEINIKSVTSEGSDSDGDLSISVTYEVNNQSDEDWEYLTVRTQLLNAAGQIVEDMQDTHEQSFDAGETEELQASFYGVKAKFLGANPEKAHVIINAVASILIQQKLGQIDIPANAFEVTALRPIKLGETVQIISGSLWKAEPDDDMDSRIEVKALIQNLTNKSLPLVKLAAEVKDKKGNEVADAGGCEEVRPGSIVTISGSGYTKDKKLIGAKADLAVLVYTPVAAGVSQHCGVQITSDAQTDEGHESGDGITWPAAGQSDSSEDEDAEGGSDSSSDGERRILVRFAMTKGDGNWPQFSELPLKKQNLAYVVSCMEFSPSFDEVEESIVAWKIVDGGLEHLTFNKNGLQGYPTPTVEFTVSGVDDDDDFLRGVWDSSYRLEVPELNEGDAYYFEDHNSNAQIVKSSGKGQGLLKQCLYANIKWFSPSEQPQDLQRLPTQFLKAKKLWDSNKNDNIDAIIGLLSKYVRARFIASNINNWEELFPDPENLGFIEIESTSVKVVGIDFGRTPIPFCKAEATFTVNVSHEFSSINLDDWQEENGRLTDGVVFYWDIPETNGTVGLDLTGGDNSGVECVALGDVSSDPN